MKLSSELKNEFSEAIRRRGLEYFADGRVRIVDGGPNHVTAQVSGHMDYMVAIIRNRRGGEMHCDCSFFDEHVFCKHLWATILAGETRGYLMKSAAASAIPEAQPSPPAWLKQLELLAQKGSQSTPAATAWPAGKQLLYLIDLEASEEDDTVVVSLYSHELKKDGKFGKRIRCRLSVEQIEKLPLPEDRAILSALTGSVADYDSYWSRPATYLIPVQLKLSNDLARLVLPSMAATGRCFALSGNESTELSEPLRWDAGGDWTPTLDLDRGESRRWILRGIFRRGSERIDFSEPRLLAGGLMIHGDAICTLQGGSFPQWIEHFRQYGRIEAPAEAGEQMLQQVLQAAAAPILHVNDELRFEEVVCEPRPHLTIRQPQRKFGPPGNLQAELSFNYGGTLIRALEERPGVWDSRARRLIKRSPDAEERYRGSLAQAGVRWVVPKMYDFSQPRWELAPAKLGGVVRKLVDTGWHIEAEGKLFRKPAEFRMNVTSGVDWFELRGELTFEDGSAQLPELIKALRRGEQMVQLDDGNYGLLPDAWLSQIGMFAGLGTPTDGHIRFRRNQAGILDALLAAQPQTSCDEVFARVRTELRSFGGLEPVPQPPGFAGHLRDYQREGLGWMEFLRRFSFGGCLADDMGVGKTAQVLALLETRRERRAAGEQLAPSLVVVPKSLVFNWKEEAARFTPQLRVFDYTGSGRAGCDFETCDVVLTTYGTLRRDAPLLKDRPFDYVVLDEAQAVKNAQTDSAKAVRLLRADHRLALSGTPVENHLGELFSLFEFLNPGMLDTSSVLKIAGSALRNPDEETRQLLARALRPFILRRTKEQVAPELPAKTEQTISCQMDPKQNKLYGELRDHYRKALLGRIDEEGLAKSKIQVLEALLRLRQAACHPGLIDPTRQTEGSAKLEVLLARLEEVLAEGHKALVFSQFTSFLALLRAELDKKKIAYEYLDGATTDRQTPVERFQNDARCPLFLISLKAGGLGLNLTAAEYVFLLDPWWNPAVEMQAIDRAHRIGQSRHVFAYRLIVRDTVEEKVLELQNRKRGLAEAIIGEDNSLIRNLQREDLELLLS